jgi:hypothetical protein
MERGITEMDNQEFDRELIKIEENVKTICDHYGFKKQSRQCVEEMSELTQAITKFMRCTDGIDIDSKSPTERAMMVGSDHVLEEIADVITTLTEMIYLMGFDEDKILAIIIAKLERQIGRIKSESDRCYRCFGAANGDCESCMFRK